MHRFLSRVKKLLKHSFYWDSNLDLSQCPVYFLAKTYIDDICFIMKDYAVVKKPSISTWMKGGLDYIVLNSLEINHSENMEMPSHYYHSSILMGIRHASHIFRIVSRASLLS
jgi:hypothetical protein